MNLRWRLRDATVWAVPAIVMITSGCGVEDEQTRACSLQSDLPASADAYEAALALNPKDIEQPAIRQAAESVVTSAQAAQAAPTDLVVTSDFFEAVNVLAELCD